LSTLESLSRAWGTTLRWIRDTAYGLMHIVKKADFSSAGGPIKIISMISHSASDGILIYLLFLALISINLAIFNLLPIPILDGGQLLLVTLETLIGRQLPHKAREYLFIGTWLVFLGLIIVLSFNDITQLISPYLTSIKQCLTLSSHSY
jgi:regulator of sigma E protease